MDHGNSVSLRTSGRCCRTHLSYPMKRWGSWGVYLLSSQPSSVNCCHWSLAQRTPKHPEWVSWGPQVETCRQTLSAYVRTMNAKGMKTGWSELRVIVQPLMISHIFLKQIINLLAIHRVVHEQGILRAVKVQIFRSLSECSYLLCITNNSET